MTMINDGEDRVREFGMGITSRAAGWGFQVYDVASVIGPCSKQAPLSYLPRFML